MNLQAKVKQLVVLRKNIAETDEQYEKTIAPLKIERDALQAAITEELKKSGVFSQRFENATVTRSVRKTLQIVDEQAAVAALKAKGLKDYYSERLTSLFFDSAAREIAKTGEAIDGTVIQEKEFLSVRLNDKAENRKVVAD